MLKFDGLNEKEIMENIFLHAVSSCSNMIADFICEDKVDDEAIGQLCKYINFIKNKITELHA